MNKLVNTLALVGLATVSGMAMAEEEHTLTGNVGIFSDYAFRGISQTGGDPAIQGGFDYAHSSGLYAGTWASNITESMYDESFLGTGTGSSNLEWDFYAGYAGSVNDDFSYNVGLLQYYYPGATDFDTTEAYAGVNYMWFGLKLSYALSDYFGAPDSDGTLYTDLSFTYTLPEDFVFSAHYGLTRGDNIDEYDDWKIGVTKELFGLNFGLAYTDTNDTIANAYIIKGDDATDGRFIVSVSKTF